MATSTTEQEEVQFGIEVEYNLVTVNGGNLANDAYLVLRFAERYHGSDHGFFPELSKAMIELTALPCSSLDDLYCSLGAQLFKLQALSEELALTPSPTSTVGAQEVGSNVCSPDLSPEKKVRFESKLKVLGEERQKILHHVAGTHIHIDWLEGEKNDKLMLMLMAADPFALMASTPFLLGKSGKNDFRVHSYRNVAYANHPVHGKLLPYPSSVDELIELQERAYQQWIEECQSFGYSLEDLQRAYGKDDTIWGPNRIRLNPKTHEARGSDTNLPFRVMALIALYKGLVNYIETVNPEIDIVEPRYAGCNGSEYFVHKNGRILLPSDKYRKRLEAEGAREGLKGERVYKKDSNLVELAGEYLNPMERRYLRAFSDSLKSRTNFSNELFAVGRPYVRNGRISEEGAKAVRLYAAEKHRDEVLKIKSDISAAEAV